MQGRPVQRVPCHAFSKVYTFFPGQNWKPLCRINIVRVCVVTSPYNENLKNWSQRKTWAPRQSIFLNAGGRFSHCTRPAIHLRCWFWLCCLFLLVEIFMWFFFFNKFIYFIIFLILAVLGLRFCARAFSSCGERGPLFIAVRRPLTVAASLVAERRLQMRRLSNCGSRAQLLRGMWDPPRPGPEPASPTLAGRLSTTAPPGKKPLCVFNSPSLN